MDMNIADLREMLSVWVGLLLIVNEILWTYLVSIKTLLAKTPKMDPIWILPWIFSVETNPPVDLTS